MHDADQHTALQQLLQKAQVCGLQNNPAVDEQSRSLIAHADREKRMLRDADIISICSRSCTNPTAISSTIKGAANYVDLCKQTLVSKLPHLFNEGGALHPFERSEACWRDCWNFLRVAIYAMATNTPECTDTEGIKSVRQLYELVNVPTSGLKLALDALSQLISKDLIRQKHRREAHCLEQALTHMGNSLHKA